MESLQVFYKVGIFLLALLFVASILERLLKQPRQGSHLVSMAANTSQSPLSSNLFTATEGRQSKSLIFTCLIIMIIVLMIPINNWMFKMEIGLTGVAPPELPYHLSGILTYFAKFAIPLLLVFLYLQTRRRSLLLVVLMGMYSIFLGVSTVSRGAALLVILAPWCFALIDRRWFLFGEATVLATFSLGLTTFSREIIYVVVTNTSGADTSLGVIGTFLETASNMEWDRLLLIIPNIIGRVEAFGSLWLASHVNPATMGGGWAVWTKTVDWGFIDLGHDAIHLELLGHTVPEGFYNVSAGVLAYMLWAVGESWLFYIPFAMLAASFLMLQEASLRKIGRCYAISPLLLNFLIFLITLDYFAAPGYNILNFIFIALFVFSRLPRFTLVAASLASIGACSTKPRIAGVKE